MLREYVASMFPVKRLLSSGPDQLRFDLRLLGEERHVGNGAGEDAPIRALRGNYRRIAGVSAPVGSRRRLTRAENLLQRAGEPSIVDRSADQSRVRSVLKESDSAAHYRART